MATGLDRVRSRWQRFASAVIAERRRLPKSAWQKAFEHLTRDIRMFSRVLDQIGNSGDSEIDPRELLIWAWCLLMSMPEAYAQLYAGLKERGTSGGSIEESVSSVRDADYCFSGLLTAYERQVRWLAALVRAIDADLTGIDYWPRRGTQWRSSHWQPAGYPCFVVPVRRDYRLQDGKERERRATRYHAIIPAALGELKVELMLHPEVAATDETRQWLYGSAIFEDMRVDIRTIGNDGFLIQDAPSPSGLEVINQQIEAALQSECDVLVWPELSITAERLAAIRSQLSKDALGSSRRIPLVVAGSWHIRDGQEWVNRATILHGRGGVLGLYDKRRQYPFGDRREAIRPGEKLLVIVMEDRLVGVAICRDFCDDCAKDVYAELSLDLILIPSMGDWHTVEAHERNCKALQSQQGAVSFVVQETPVAVGAELPEGASPGYSFARPPGDALRHAQNEPFRVLRARR